MNIDVDLFVDARPEHWAAEAAQPRFDLTEFIGAVNRMKAAAPALNVDDFTCFINRYANDYRADPAYALAMLVERALTCAVAPSTWQPLKEEHLALFAA